MPSACSHSTPGPGRPAVLVLLLQLSLLAPAATQRDHPQPHPHPHPEIHLPAIPCLDSCSSSPSPVCLWTIQRTFVNPCHAWCHSSAGGGHPFYVAGTCAAAKEQQRHLARSWFPGRALLSAGNDDGSDGPCSDSQAYLALDYLLFMVLTGVILAKLLHSFVPIVPYSVGLILWSVAIGALHKGTDYGLGLLSHSITQWVSIDPHLLLYVFLPPLIFGDSMSMNVHAAARAFWQIFLLACPGVVLGTVLMAVVSKCLLPYGWDWNVCLCFGSILAATDPVAVVGLLKNMGASPKLTMLVAGESLMNDGTAIVLFTLFLNMSKGEVYTGWEVLQYFCKVALGGPALGLLFGLAGLLILGMMGKQEDHLSVTCQIALTIALAYGAFFWGEHSARVSGVLCTVTAALVLAFWGWPFFGSRRTVEIIWHTIDFLFNTVVFMLAGVIIGVAARSSTVEAADYGWVIMLYLCATLVRAGMVALLFPALTRIGWGCSPKECVVLWWGGLKGAVGLALAIIVDETEEEGEVDTKHKNMTFLVGGVAVLSLLINGTSCEWLVRRLGLATASEAKRRILAYVRDKICDKATRQYDELAESDEFADHSKELVRRWCTVLRRENFCLCPDDPKPAVGESGGSDSELMATTREVFLQATQAGYWELKERGELPGGNASANAMHILLQAIDEAQDRTATGLYDWERVEAEMGFVRHGFFRGLGDKMSWLSGFFSKVSNDRNEMNAYVARNFIKAHRMAQERVCFYFGRDQSADTPEEKQVIAESNASIRAAVEFLERMDARVVQVVVSKQIGSQILRSARHEIDLLREQGLLTAGEAHEMESVCVSEMQRIVEYSRGADASEETHNLLGGKSE